MPSKGPFRTAIGSNSTFDCNHRVCGAEQFQSVSLCLAFSVVLHVFRIPWIRHLCLFSSRALSHVLAIISSFSNIHAFQHDTDIIRFFTGGFGRTSELHLRRIESDVF